MAGQHVATFDESNFEAEVLQSDKPVLVDFWAEWCGPCRALAPVIDELAGDYAGRVKVGKLDIDKSPGVAERYGISSIPTVVLFDKGQSSRKMVGIKPKREYQALLDAAAAAR